MTMAAVDAKKLLKKYQARKRLRKGDPDRVFDIMFNDALAVHNQSKEVLSEVIGPGVAKLKRLADHYLIVSLVSCLEVYFKNLIISHSKWDEKGYESLLDDKIRLSEAYIFFNKEKVSRDFIIAHHYSFSSFESINSVLSKLIGKDFYAHLETYEPIIFEPEDDRYPSLIAGIDNWRSVMIQIYDIRNKFIHEGKMQLISQKQLQEYFSLVIMFQGMVGDFLIADRS